MKFNMSCGLPSGTWYEFRSEAATEGGCLVGGGRLVVPLEVLVALPAVPIGVPEGWAVFPTRPADGVVAGDPDRDDPFDVSVPLGVA